MPAPAPPYLAKAGQLMDAGKFAEAAALLRLNLRRDPPARALLLLALACEALNERDATIYHLRAARAADPADAEIALQLADYLADRKLFDDSLAILDEFFRRSGPTQALATVRAAILSKAGRRDEALAAADHALTLFPGSREVLSARGVILRALGRIEEAVAAFELARMPDQVAATYLEAGDPRAMTDSARAAATLSPSDPAKIGLLAFSLNYDDRCTAQEVAAAHREFGRALAARVKPMTAWTVSREPERRLRVGLLSPDLRQHACVSFLRALFEGRSREEWELTAYSISEKQDAVSRELEALSDRWRYLPRPQGSVLAETIAKDRIDVLIDLAGNTQGHRLDALQRRPAPVQMTWLGYPNTTGLAPIRWRIVDSRTDPAGTDELAVERLARIDPCFLCYRPMLAAPEPRRDAAPGAPIVFGSFNLPLKITPACLDLWSAALRAVPGSTIVLKHIALSEPWTRGRVLDRLLAAGIPSNAVSVIPPTESFQDHLDSYSRVDIALDTFPYHGTTTTCEALWMGVPVLTLRGDRHAARVGDSLMHAAGLGELVAGEPPAFGSLAARVAADRDRLRAWRSAGPGGLREIMRASPLCDGPAFCTRFHAAVRAAWREWCAGATA